VGDGNAMWWRSPYVASIGVVIVGLALSFSAWFAVLQRENRLAHEEFEAAPVTIFWSCKTGSTNT
jgi:hypothetical protein